MHFLLINSKLLIITRLFLALSEEGSKPEEKVLEKMLHCNLVYVTWCMHTNDIVSGKVCIYLSGCIVRKSSDI